MPLHSHPFHDRGAIGLLAGMGVRSTAPFLDLVIRRRLSPIAVAALLGGLILPVGATGEDGVAEDSFTAKFRPVGSEFQVNTYTSYAQFAPAVAIDADGNFVVVWESNLSGGTDVDFSVQGQRYASDGAALGGQFQVNTYTTSTQASPSVAVDADGDFVVVWASDGSQGTDSARSSIQGQRYASDGSTRGAEFQVNSFTTGRQRYPAVALAPDGDFVVVWQSNGSPDTDSASSSIQGQRFASDGSVLGGQFQVNSYTTSSQGVPAVAVDSDGDFVVVWQSNGSPDTDSSDFSVQGQRYASDSAALGGQFQVNSYTPESQRAPAVALAPDGDFVVVWQNNSSPGTDPSIQGQRYASEGSALGGQFQVNSLTTNLQVDPVVAVAADGDFVVVWQSNGPPGTGLASKSLQGRRYTSDGLALGGQVQVNSYTTSFPVLPSVALDADGDFVVVWQSVGSRSIQGQRFRLTQACVPDDTTLCLNDGRFKVDIVWKDFQGNEGPGRVVRFGSADSGLFWFFAPDNWEMLIKVLNGCNITSHYWVFAAATTNVEYTLRVTDTETGTVTEYFNPLGNAAAALTDTRALATCP